MKTRLPGIVAAALALLLGSLAAGAVTPPDATAAKPQLAIRTLDGKTFDLAAERGKWVIVNFWATWCAPCIEEMPAISEFVTTHADVAAIGLAWEDTPRDKVLAFARKHPVDYPLALVDMDHPPADFAAPLGLPSTYLIAPDGHVAKHFIGPVDAKQLAQAIRAASSRSAAPRSPAAPAPPRG